MSISKKKIATLINEFLKTPVKFENYVKGCLDSIKKINYLKDVQFDETVNNYDYFKCFSEAIPFDITIAFINSLYRKEIIEQIPNEMISHVKTNVFYVDKTRSFIESLSDNKSVEPKIYFSRMNCIICINKNYINENNNNHSLVTELFHDDKVFSINELINLSNDNMITIIDNYVKQDDISTEELKNGINSGTMILHEADLNWVGLDSKVFADFLSCKNDYDRLVWQTLYNCLLNYIRKSKVYCDNSNDNTNGYNLQFYFYQTIDHLKEIFSKIESTYRKKKKNLPDKYAKVIIESRKIIEVEKGKFKSELHDVDYKKVLSKQKKYK